MVCACVCVKHLQEMESVASVRERQGVNGQKQGEQKRFTIEKE